MAKRLKTPIILKVTAGEVLDSQLDPGDVSGVPTPKDFGASYEDSSGGVCGGGTNCQGTYCEKGYSSTKLE